MAKITEFVRVGFTPDQLERARREAEQQKTSVSALIRNAVDAYVLPRHAQRCVDRERAAVLREVGTMTRAKYRRKLKDPEFVGRLREAGIPYRVGER